MTAERTRPGRASRLHAISLVAAAGAALASVAGVSACLDRPGFEGLFPCDSDDDCTGSDVCLIHDDGERLCTPETMVEEIIDRRADEVTDIACESFDDCLEGMTCQRDDDGQARCIGLSAAEEERDARKDQITDTTCDSDGDCLAGMVCQGHIGVAPRCIGENAAEEERSALDSCESDLDCGGNAYCATNSIGGETMSICTIKCVPGVLESVCPEATHCAPFLAHAAEGACFARCTSDADCSLDRSCDAETGRCTCDFDADCSNPNVSLMCRGGGCTLGCTDESDCHCGTTCDDGACKASCSSDDDCCGDATCDTEGRCGPPNKFGGADGDECFRSVHCEFDLVCPDGTCEPHLGDCDADREPHHRCEGGGFCPHNSDCVDEDECRCHDGFRAVSCGGEDCDGDCPGGEWYCEEVAEDDPEALSGTTSSRPKVSPESATSR